MLLEEYSVQFQQLFLLYREMKVFHLSGIFSAYNDWLGEGDINIKNNNTHNVGVVKPSVLWPNI